MLVVNSRASLHLVLLLEQHAGHHRTICRVLAGNVDAAADCVYDP